MFSDVDRSYKDNAAWDDEAKYVTFGRGTGPNMDFILAIDVVGHEWTHAVTQYTADLEYEGESGALNESFSDIFGTMVEFFAQGGSGDYLIGEDIWEGPGKFRSMRNPNDESQPDTYDGDYWIQTSGCTPNNYNDVCGVHTNSGVQNYWFYLLSESGSGKNDGGYQFSVTSIGRDRAAEIAYRNLTYYLTSSSDYFDARTGSTWSAVDLYGIPSTEVTQVVNAWFAVGVVDGDTLILLQRDPLDTDAVYVAAESITAASFGVANEGRVLMYAGSKITLSPGFSAASGSEFHAFINPAFSDEE
jgi:Zn-dependent metalloprotease